MAATDGTFIFVATYPDGPDQVSRNQDLQGEQQRAAESLAQRFVGPCPEPDRRHASTARTNDHSTPTDRDGTPRRAGVAG